MKKAVLYFMLFLTSWHVQAQVGLLNPLPSSLKIDFANPKAPEYRRQYKEYKDTIKSLSRLEKYTLIAAAKNLSEMPVKGGKKVKYKDARQTFLKYREMVNEVDSAETFFQKMEAAKLYEVAPVKKNNKHLANIQKIKKVRFQGLKIMKWRKAQNEDEQDSVQHVRQLYEYIKQHENEIPWEELEVDKEEFMSDFEEVKDDEELKEITETKNTEQVTEITDSYFGSYENYKIAKTILQETESLLGEADKYRTNITKILHGDFSSSQEIESVLVSRAKEVGELRGITEEIGKAEAFEKQMQEKLEEIKYKSDLNAQYEEHVKSRNKERLTNEALGLAGDKLKDHQNEILKAQKAMDTYQSKYINYQNTEGNVKMEKKNSLKGKPLSDRLVIGGYLQINRNSDYSAVDFSPQIGYKWTKNYLWGIGATYRFKFNDKVSVLRDEEIYGGRFFMEYSVGKLFAHSEYEMMSHAKADPDTDVVRRINSPGLMAGLGANYNFLKGVKGNVMVLYNFLYSAGTSPYGSPFVFRFGFNLNK